MRETSALEKMAPEPDSEWFPALICGAQCGSKQAVGQLLEGCRQYLMLIANRELQDGLRAKAGASDIVQQSFLEAQRSFHQFSGETEADLLAWLRGILLHNLRDFARRYVGTAKRRVSRERRLDSDVMENTFQAGHWKAEPATPSGWLMRQEQAQILRDALAQLGDDDRQILLLRYSDGLTFAEIGRRMQRSPAAARMLWSRALERLAARLERSDA